MFKRHKLAGILCRNLNEEISARNYDVQKNPNFYLCEQEAEK